MQLKIFLFDIVRTQAHWASITDILQANDIIIIGNIVQHPHRTLLLEILIRWGSSSEKERLMRKFMYGVGKIIAGVFCITVGSPLVGTIGFGVGCDGFKRLRNRIF